MINLIFSLSNDSNVIKTINLSVCIVTMVLHWHSCMSSPIKKLTLHNNPEW